MAWTNDTLWDVLRRLPTTFHLVWGRVVADIPVFCRALVAALSEG